MAQNEVVLDGELSLSIPLDGEVGHMSLIEVGISEIKFNPDYTITFVMTDGREFTTGSVRGAIGEQGAKGDTGIQGEKGETGPQGPQGEKGDKGAPGNDYNLTEQDKQDIAGLVDTPVDDVQIDGTSIVNNGVAGIPFATLEQPGVGRIGADYGITMLSGKRFVISRATSAVIKSGTQNYRPIVSSNQHEAVFYGLAKVAGHDEKNSTLAVGTYTDEAKTAIRTMLGIDKESLIAEIRDALNL